MILTLIVFAATVLLDRLTKAWAMGPLRAAGDLPLWEGVFHFHYTENRGAAFGMFQGMGWAFIAITVLALAVVAVVLWKTRGKMHPLLAVCLGLLAGGAVGNLIDRLWLGYVVDFLYFKLINFAIFNVADACITSGAIGLALYVLFVHERYKARQAGSAPESAVGVAQGADAPLGATDAGEPAGTADVEPMALAADRGQRTDGGQTAGAAQQASSNHVAEAAEQLSQTPDVMVEASPVMLEDGGEGAHGSQDGDRRA